MFFWLNFGVLKMLKNSCFLVEYCSEWQNASMSSSVTEEIFTIVPSNPKLTIFPDTLIEFQPDTLILGTYDCSLHYIEIVIK